MKNIHKRKKKTNYYKHHFCNSEHPSCICLLTRCNIKTISFFITAKRLVTFTSPSCSLAKRKIIPTCILWWTQRSADKQQVHLHFSRLPQASRITYCMTHDLDDWAMNFFGKNRHNAVKLYLYNSNRPDTLPWLDLMHCHQWRSHTRNFSH